MSKLLKALLFGAAALAMNVTAMAADQKSGDNQARDNQTQAQPNSPDRKPDQRDAERAARGGSTDAAQQGQSQAQGGADDSSQQNQTANQAGKAGADEGNMGRSPDQTGGDVTAKEKEYLAQIKKCDPLSGDQKKQCITAAKKKAGQM